MSLFYNNDPFWSFFDNINDEVNNFNRLLNRQQRQQPKANNKLLANGAANGTGNAVLKRAEKKGLASFFNDPFFNDNSLLTFGTDADLVPPVDILDNDKDYTLHVSVPGAPKDQITIDFNKNDNQLIIKGTIPSSKPLEDSEAKDDEKQPDHYFERSSGSFERRVTLPTTVDGDKIKATVENGVLTLTVPKTDAKDDSNYKRIEISSSESYSS